MQLITFVDSSFRAKSNSNRVQSTFLIFSRIKINVDDEQFLCLTFRVFNRFDVENERSEIEWFCEASKNFVDAVIKVFESIHKIRDSNTSKNVFLKSFRITIDFCRFVRSIHFRSSYDHSQNIREHDNDFTLIFCNENLDRSIRQRMFIVRTNRLRHSTSWNFLVKTNYSTIFLILTHIFHNWAMWNIVFDWVFSNIFIVISFNWRYVQKTHKYFEVICQSNSKVTCQSRMSMLRFVCWSWMKTFHNVRKLLLLVFLKFRFFSLHVKFKSIFVDRKRRDLIFIITLFD